MKTTNTADLVGKDLTHFTVKDMILLKDGGQDGREYKPVALYTNEGLVDAIMAQEEMVHMAKRHVKVLTDTREVFIIISEDDPVEVADEETVLQNVKIKALSKLSEKEQVLLGLK